MLARNTCSRPSEQRCGCWTLSPAQPLPVQTSPQTGTNPFISHQKQETPETIVAVKFTHLQLRFCCEQCLTSLRKWVRSLHQLRILTRNQLPVGLFSVLKHWIIKKGSRIWNLTQRLYFNHQSEPVLTKKRHYNDVPTALVQQKVMQNAVRPQISFPPCLCQAVIYFKHSALPLSCLKYDRIYQMKWDTRPKLFPLDVYSPNLGVERPSFSSHEMFLLLG